MKSIMLIAALLFSTQLMAKDKEHHCYECKNDHKHHYKTKAEAEKHCKGESHEVACKDEHDAHH